PPRPRHNILAGKIKIKDNVTMTASDRANFAVSANSRRSRVAGTINMGTIIPRLLKTAGTINTGCFTGPIRTATTTTTTTGTTTITMGTTTTITMGTIVDAAPMAIRTLAVHLT